MSNAAAPDMCGFTIRARVYDDGTHEIIIVPGKEAATLADACRRRASWTNNPFRALIEWHVSEVDTLAEVRSTLMTAFGIGWYNRARARVAELEGGGNL